MMQLFMASASFAMCQNASCRLPGDWLLSSPTDFTAAGSLPEYTPGHDADASIDDTAEFFVSPTATRMKRSDTFDEDGYSLRAHGLHAGGLHKIDENTFVAYSLAYEDSRQRANDRLSRTDSKLYYAGLAAERHFNAWRLHGSIGLGLARHAMRRSLNHETDAAQGYGSVRSRHGVLGAGVSYRLEGNDWHLEPRFGVALLYEHTPAYREHGLGANNQHARRSESLKTLLTPGIEFGKNLQRGKTHLLYWVSAGLTLLPDNTWTTRGYLAGAPDVELVENATLPSAMGDFRFGILLSRDAPWSLHFQYGLQTGSHYRAHSGALRLAWAF